MRKIQRYGWKPDLPSIHDKYFCDHHRIGAAIAPSVRSLVPMCPNVYDQGQLGSCTANAISGLAQFLMMKDGGHAYRPSRLDVYYWERQVEGTIGTDSGAQISDGIQVVSTQGLPPEFIDQYNIANFTNAPSAAAVAYGSSHKLGSAYRVNQDVDEIHTVIGSNGLPIVFGFTVYESFESDAVATTGMVPMPGANEQVVGGHAVVAVGYNDKKKLVTVRNSWGSGWGVNGYCYFPYDYFLSANLVSDLWTATDVS